MTEAWDDPDATVESLPELPGLVRVLGAPLPEGDLEEVRYSRDGRILLASLYPGMSRAYDVETGERLLETRSFAAMEQMRAHPRRARWTAWWMVVCALGGLFGLGTLAPRLTRAGKRWARSLTGPTGLADLDLTTRQVRALPHETACLSPDGRVWASLEGDEPLAFFDARTGTKISTSRRKILAGDAGPRCFSEDGSRFAAETRPGIVGLWEVRTGRLSAALKSHSGEVTALAISPDGTLLASAGGDGTLVLWDLESGCWMARQVGWELGVSTLAFLNHRGRRLLAVSDRATLGLFDLPELTPATRIDGGDAGLSISQIAGSPDGTRLAVGRTDDTVHLLDVAALLGAPQRIAADPVRVAAEGPPSEADERRHTEAFEALLQARLDLLTPALEQELRTLAAELPAKTARTVFWCDPGEAGGGEGIAWQAESSTGEILQNGTLQAPAGLNVEAELGDPKYRSAQAAPDEILDRVVVAWLGVCWRAAVPRPLRGYVRRSYGEGRYDLRSGSWS